MKPFFIFLLALSAPLLAEEESALTQSELIAEASKPALSAEKEAETPPQAKEESHPIPLHEATESYETAFIKTIVVLVGLLVLVILTIWMFRKISNGRFRGMNVLKSVKILEKRPLSPKSMLYLIEVSGKQILLAESQLEVRNVATLDYLGSDKDL